MASDTFSAVLGFLLQGTGNNNNTWGALLNTGDFDQIETAIAGVNAQTVTGGTLDLSGSPPPAGPSGAIAAVFNFSGTLASNQIIKVPNLSKKWLVNNLTTGTFTLTFTTPSGPASTSIPQGGWCIVWCDGNNNIYVGISTASRDVQMLAPDGTLAAPGIAFTLEGGTGIRRKGTNDITIVVGGVDLIEITGAGAGTPNVVNILSPAVFENQGNPIVAGPATSVVGDFALFNSATGALLSDSGSRLITSGLLAPGAAPLPYVATQVSDNLHLINDATNPTRDMDVTAGRVRSDDDSTNLHLNATLIKRLDTAFASGTNAGACDSGSKGASQTWHLYVIGKVAQAPTLYARTSNVATLTFGAAHNIGVGATVRVINVAAGFDGIATITAVASTTISYASTGSNVSAIAPPATATADFFDVLASQSYPSPTMPSGWTVKQCLGSILTDTSSNIIAFFQYGDEFWLKVPILNATITTGGSTTVTTSAPSGVKTKAFLNASAAASGSATMIAYFSPLDATDLTASDSAAPGTQLAGNGAFIVAVQIGIQTSTSSQVRCNIGTFSGSGSLIVVTAGWRDPRRRLF